MADVRIIRHLDLNDLVKRTATRLVDRLIELQSEQEIVNLCLSGTATMPLYSELGKAIGNSPLDPTRLELWWDEERFVPATHPDRIAAMTLAALAKYFTVDPSHTHPMPGQEGHLDADEAAATYARELGDTCFDICLLSIGEAGETGSLYPDHPAMKATGQVVAVRDAPDSPYERLTLTIKEMSRSAEIWFIAGYAEKAPWVRDAIAGDPKLAAGQIRGTKVTNWLIDQHSAAYLPYFQCSMQ